MQIFRDYPSFEASLTCYLLRLACCMVGQVLYLEAEETGIRSTGIGCYFGDPVHEAFGIT